MAKVKLRERKSKDGRTSLFLAYWDSSARHTVTRGKDAGTVKAGKWTYEFIKDMHLTGDKKRDNEVMRLANKIRGDKEWELSRRTHPALSSVAEDASFIDFFEMQAKSKKRTGKTQQTWMVVLKHLKDFSGDIKISQLDVQWLEGFRQYLLDHISVNTSSTYFSKIKTALNQAVKLEHISIDQNPGLKVSPISMIDVEKIYLTMDEIQKLAKAECINGEIKRAFLFSCFSGLRLSDLKSLIWSNIKVDTEGGGYKLNFRQTKTKGFEYFPLHKSAVKIILDEPLGNKNKQDKIFKIPTPNWTNEVLDKWSKAAGFERMVRFHQGRHSFATNSLAAGADIYIISRLLGHRNIQSTQIYVQVIGEKKRQAVNLLPDIEMRF